MHEEIRVRHSAADQAEVVSDELTRAKLEAANSVRQAEWVRQLILASLDGRPFRLRTSTILDLNRCAIDGLDAYAGNFRPGAVRIGESKHQPPGGHLVAALVEELCDYVNDNWSSASSVHLASMVMWRMNWIHPFTDGNGRTSRAASYLVLCAHSRALLAGEATIPDQIVANRMPYYEALEASDKRYDATRDLGADTVFEMEDLMRVMLAKQLKSAFDIASGTT